MSGPSLRSWVLGLGSAGFFCLAASAAAEHEVIASIEPEVIGVDETASFSLEVRGDSFSSLRFRPDFELENLEIAGPPSKYEDMRFVNGSFARTLRLSWRVRPLGIGEARVRSISVQLDDEIVQLPPQALRVQREPTQHPRPLFEEEDPFQSFFGRMPNPWRRETGEPEVFLGAEVQPRRPVVGQQVLYTLYLYTREDIATLSPSGVPTFRGFWVQDIPLPQQLPTEMVEIDGRRYGRVPLLRKALFPLRPGRFEVEPATVDLTVQRYGHRLFFRPPPPQTERLRLRTDGQWIDVQRLPPAPAGFGGAVGQIAVKAELQPREIRLGEAATLTVRLSGAGNLQGIREPKISPPPGLTFFPPQQEGKHEIFGTTVRGKRTWRYVVVADRAGRYTVEAPRIPYYDPPSRRYRVATASPLSLTALPLSTAAAAAGDGAAPHGIRYAALSPGAPPGRHWTKLLPWLFALPWCLALVVTLTRRRAGTGGLRRRRSAAERELADGLRRAGTEQRPRQAAARIEEAWRGLLAERWNVPAAAPPSRWPELLTAAGAGPETVTEMRRLVEDLQYLRSAPQLSATGALRDETLDRCGRLRRRLH